MIVARHPAGAVAITQADHAVMCAEFADAWSSLRDSPFAADVRLAAEQHELGWAERDAAPRLNPATGLPFSLRDLPFREYIDAQLVGPRELGERSPYAGLLASLHYASFYRRPAPWSVRADDRILRSFLARSSHLQAALARRAGVGVEDPQTVRDAGLVRCWDGLSYDLLLDRVPGTRPLAPLSSGDPAALQLERRGDRVTIEPWPFAPARLEVHAQGRLLAGTYGSEAELHAALAAAEVVILAYTLVPAASLPADAGPMLY